MTFSIAGRCADTGMLGVAVTTSSICVGSRCPWVRAGVGAISTQNITLPSLGRIVLDEIAAGGSAEVALREVMAAEPSADYRQLIVIDANGRTGHFSGAHTLGTNNVATGKDCIAGGNILSNDQVPQAIVDGFLNSTNSHLSVRLLDGLTAGAAAGGEVGPTRSAALLVAHVQEWPLVDLRVDWCDDDPIAALHLLWLAYEPEMAPYLTRALNPGAAPRYGVPGDV